MRRRSIAIAVCAVALGAADAGAAPAAAAAKPTPSAKPPKCPPGKVARRLGAKRWRCVKGSTRLTGAATAPVTAELQSALVFPLDRLPVTRIKSKRVRPADERAVKRLTSGRRGRLGVFEDQVAQYHLVVLAADLRRRGSPLAALLPRPPATARSAGGRRRALPRQAPDVTVGSTFSFGDGKGNTAKGSVSGSATVTGTGDTARAQFVVDSTLEVSGPLARETGSDVKLDTKMKVTLDKDGFTIDDAEMKVTTDKLSIATTVSGTIRLAGDACPTTAGVLKSKADVDLTTRTTMRLRAANILLFTETKRTLALVSTIGQTADDAKLDTLDVLDDATVRVTTSALGLGTADHTYDFLRRTVVNMRTGAYGPLTSGTRHRIGLSGFFALYDRLSNADRAAAEAALDDADRTTDKSFKGLVDRAVEADRKAETRWQTPGVCAEAIATPPSYTLKLQRGDSGAFTVALKAKRDGGAPFSRFTRTAATNATSDPESFTATGEQPVRYTVTGSDGEASATYRATSKAGVGEAVWSQPIKPADDRAYRVLAVSLTQKLTGVGKTVLEKKPGWPPCTLTATDTTAMSLGAQPFDAANAIDGRGFGLIGAIGPGSSTVLENGCNAQGSCPVSATDPAALQNVFFAIAPTGDPGTTKLTWSSPTFGIAWPGVIDFGCYADNITPEDRAGGGPPEDYDVRRVPTDVFTATTPQTLAFSFTGTVVSSTGVRSTLELTESITFQRVRADGSPL